jgi:type II secretory pathway pseudopilin PulG
MRAFSLLDLLVSIAIVATLMGIMLPSLRKAQNAARQVVCSSNTRQHGMGLMMYAQDYQDAYPLSKFSNSSGLFGTQFEKTVIVRDSSAPKDWDGLGLLYSMQYLDAPKVFYCPSHRGDNPYSRYAQLWGANFGMIVANYQYRGALTTTYSDPSSFALLTDSLRTKRDFNHLVGTNVLLGDISVLWVPDRSGELARSLPESENDWDASGKVEAAWQAIDLESKKVSTK